MTVMLEDWVGRTEEAEDVLTPALVERFAAVLGLRGVRASAASGPPRAIRRRPASIGALPWRHCR